MNSGDFVPGHETRIFNNTCVLPPRGSNGRDPDVVAHVGRPCAGPSPGNLIAYNNHYHTLNGNASESCGDGSVKLVSAMPTPFESASTSGPIPDGPTLITWAKQMLDLP